jgi:hypothetical protein
MDTPSTILRFRYSSDYHPGYRSRIFKFQDNTTSKTAFLDKKENKIYICFISTSYYHNYHQDVTMEMIAIMRKHCARPLIVLVMVVTLTVSLTGCSWVTTPSSTPTKTTTLTPTPSLSGTPVYTQYQLEYLLLTNYPDIFWCDPDFYPVAREGQEQANAILQFPAMRANASEFSAILEHLVLPDKADYSDLEKLEIYQQHKLLTHTITLALADNVYDFNLRTGQNQGWYIEGTVTPYGKIRELKKEVSFNTCPICLTRGTLINTPDGNIPVEQLKTGMIVWTLDKMGHRTAAPIKKTSSTEVPASFQVVKLTLNDGRSVTASPGHPTADMRALEDYCTGDSLDNSLVSSTEKIDYIDRATYDLLPYGDTGSYWANGILLMSTLH